MKNRAALYNLLVALAIVSMLSACRTYYAPNAINTPLFQEKGELRIHASGGSTTNAQIAYALTDHVGIMANGVFARHADEDAQAYTNRGMGGELGIGYFGSTTNRLTYEAYVGGGAFDVKTRAANETKRMDVRGTRFFIQPGIGWVSRYFDVGFSPRLVFLNYQNPSVGGFSPQEIQNQHFDVMGNSMYSFIEPTLTLRGGYDWVKLQLQVGRSFKLNKELLNYDDGVFSLGLSFDIGEWYKE